MDGWEHRRIAQWQSASKHTEEAARFESCSAYQPSPANLLFLSHCVPNPPDKGEKIRSYHLFRHLARRYAVHLVCFARQQGDLEHAQALAGCCASQYVEWLPARRSLARAMLRFARRECLVTSFYRSARMARHVEGLASLSPFATVAYSSAMVQYAPAGIPLLLDMVDVDSEKWLQYGRVRRPAFLYAEEGRRLRAVEARCAALARCSWLSTGQERELLQAIAPAAPVRCVENGIDFDYFDPRACPPEAELAQRDFVVFVGAMDYFPNADACCWFAREVFPEARRQAPGLEFLIVGRNPSRAVRRLRGLPGVTVVGSVADVRPYLASARAVVAPLRIARGVQNKVLEALAMGRCVFASPAVCASFGRDLPAGVVACASSGDYVQRIADSAAGTAWNSGIREQARRRFCWENIGREFSLELEAIAGAAVG